MTETRRYIVLPDYGFTSSALTNSKLQAGVGVRRLDVRSGLREKPGAGEAALATAIKVLDAIRLDGPKLVEMTSQAELNLRAEIPGLKIIPIFTYRKMQARQVVLRPAAATAAAGTSMVVNTLGITVRVVDAVGGAGLPGVKIVAFTNFADRAGDEGMTGKDGTVTLQIEPDTTLERFYAYGPAGYWGYFAEDIKAQVQGTVQIAAIELDGPDLLLRRIYGEATEQAGANVIVGIVDSGVDRHHPNLPNVTGGANMVFDETRADPSVTDAWGPAVTDGEHGTHVAGIVGARPAQGRNLVGVAPGVTLRSYRVFPDNGGEATNYDIMKAIDRAVADGCHVINLSLGGGSEDEGIRSAIGAALDAGRLVVAAAGNGYRQAVSFPATLDACVAVSAMGHTSSFPPASSEAGDIATPSGNDSDAFVAAFSNYGPQIDLVGPGVGVVSTLPNGAFGVMSGTSMAAPAIAGFAARLMAADPEIRGAEPARRVAIWKAKLLGLGSPQGFGRDYEGSGLPFDAGVS